MGRGINLHKENYIRFILILLVLCFVPQTVFAKPVVVKDHKQRSLNIKAFETQPKLKRFTFDSGLSFSYPDAVRGIYVTGPSAGGERFESLIELIETTDLNTMVIDVKEDYGRLTFKPDKDSIYYDEADSFISDPKELLKELEERDIYPVARIVVFKDSVLAKERPELSFTKNGKVWANSSGESFVNPYMKEVWEHNIEVAHMAAELGFQEIQFDYVRFPEGFETRDDDLEYSLGEYKDSDLDGAKKRVQAVTDFVAYANEELSTYDVDVSVDIFGYAATITETPGIGQNFSKISDNVDVISSMIYPSHWTSYFGIEMPDKEPYKLVDEYAKVENDVLGKLDDPPVSRPWIQDFNAPWLYPNGGVTNYGIAEVEAQIRGLNENGIDEFLLWNAGNTYTEGVNYKPLD